MFCGNCGNEIRENGKFCTTCGAKVGAYSVGSSARTYTKDNSSDKILLLIMTAVMIFIMCCPFYRIYEVTLYTTFGMDVSEGLRETENPNIIDAIKDFLEQGEFIPAEYKGNEQLEILLFLYLLLVCVEVVILIVGIGYLKELIVYKEPVDGYILAETILS